MTWITDNKGAGPWAFEEQPNKWGYINNPRWQSEPTKAINYTGRENEVPQVWPMEGSFSSGDSKQHNPCGYWYKKKAISLSPGKVRITQEVIEVLRQGSPYGRITQETVEVLRHT